MTDANKIIAACNQIAELATRLAAEVEQAAWEGFEDHAGMAGVRPIAAAQLAQPGLEVAYQDHIHQQDAEAPVVEVSVEQVREALAVLSKQGKTAKARELIEQAGAVRLSAVEPSKYAWLLAEAQAVADGLE
ncbi:hypothetical protein [Corynebacterium guaraldiae]|uniref:hypothetical protein n=1 Tax=Corynebacterium guaraldiae TaxID=3051103 RepID=UPI0020945D5B|nr:hypothetical protein [Corynebacterium guaraldiae]